MSDAVGTARASDRALIDAALIDPGPPSEAAQELARTQGLCMTAADALQRRGRRSGADLEAWLDPKLSQLTSPAEMADLPVAAERIGRAIRNGERIAVFGDYDCDGVTATAIMTQVIAALGGEVVPLLASRFRGGYGFSPPAVERVRETGASLLITCDCGSSDHPQLEAARLAGIDSVVIDHHLVPDEALPVVAFLNPHRPECGFPYKGLASCGLALFVATALRKQLKQRLDVRAWLDLVAVGTIADVAPLTGDNRVLVRAGLRRIGNGERVGLDALAMNGASGRKQPVSAEHVSYQIAPRLNAPGRLSDPDLALQLLLERDAAQAWLLAERIEQLTVKRREVQAKIVKEALAEVERCRYADDAGIVLASADWHPGVVGIVAGRLADQVGKPSIVIALDGASGRGSARTPAGFRLYDAIAASRESLIGFGGHQAAAGVELEAAQVDRFRQAFVEACAAQQRDKPLQPPSVEAEVRLDARDKPMDVVADLERIEPCGEGNPAVRLLLSDVEVCGSREIKGHLKLELRLNGERIGAFAPNQGELVGSLNGGRVDLVARLKRDHWRGGLSPELLVERIVSPG